jgi:signal transduction histidine kinase
VLWANDVAGRFLNCDVKAMEGKQCIEMCGNQKFPLNNMLEVCLNTGQPGKNIASDQQRVAEIRMFPIFQGEDKDVSHVILSILDISEKMDLQQKSLRTSHLATLGVLSASIAHEINNPNNIIMLNAPMLKQVWERVSPDLQETKRDPTDPLTLIIDDVPELIDAVEEASGRIKRIVSQLKHLVRRDSGEMTANVDMKNVVNEAVTLLTNKIQKYSDYFNVSSEPNPPAIRGNSQQLGQVVINLIVNALEALSDRSKGVKVSLRHDSEADSLLLIVKDEGQGIPKENIPKITEALFTTRGDEGGTGLGLSISQQIINQHSGTLDIQSEVNSGTTITVKLPLSGK